MRFDDALVVAETIIFKCNEFKLLVREASLDMKKAFGRVFRVCIFDVLRSLAIYEQINALLIKFDSRQTRVTSGSKT